MTHRDLCIKVAQYLIEQPWCQLVGWEISYNRGFADVLALTLKDKDPNPRICVIEVKRTRSDLLQDLNKLKLLKYEQGTSHCYLAATKEALKYKDPKSCLEDLTKLGLPKNWGVLLIEDEVSSLKAAQRINKTNIMRTRSLTKKIARSHMWRQFNDPGKSLQDSEEEC